MREGFSMSERFPDGLPETHFTLTYFDQSTWAHLRLGRRVRGQWSAVGALDLRLPSADLFDVRDDQRAMWMIQTEEFIRRLRLEPHPR